MKKTTNSILPRRCERSGWVSFPIMVLIFSLASASIFYNANTRDIYAWVSEQAPYRNNDRVWQTFKLTVAIDLPLSLAQKSLCLGFCPLEWSNWPQELWILNTRVLWQLDFFEGTQPPSQAQRYYRLCARLDHNHVPERCWWYQHDLTGVRLLGYNQF